MENPKNVADIITVITESRTDFSLPYLVYTTKTIRAINPTKRKIHAKNHNVEEGNSAIYCCHIFFIYYKFMKYFFLTLL
jgi:hypothetical protein